jgi:DNA-directed RNA polymerase subunit E'/Rpb7
MIIKKRIQTAININDCIGFYTDFENNLMDLLKNRFINRCFRKCFIIEILEIIRSSECVINQDGAPDFGTINVIFDVNAIIYTPGEIINGVNVVSRDGSGILTCDTEHANIVVGYDPLFNSVYVGQKISIRVYKTKYTIGSDKIDISAVPVVFEKSAILFKYIPDNLPGDFVNYISDNESKINAVNAELEKLKNEPGYKVFSMLFYPFSTPKELPKGAAQMSIFEFAKNPPNKQCYITRDPRILHTTSLIAVYDTPSDCGISHEVANCDIKGEIILSTLMDLCYNQMRSVVELIKIYNEPKMVEAHKNIWLIYTAIKRREIEN